MSLDPPIKQGQTRYHYLVFLFGQEEDITIELPFTEYVKENISVFTYGCENEILVEIKDLNTLAGTFPLFLFVLC